MSGIKLTIAGYYTSTGSMMIMLGGRLVRSGMIYWSQCMEGLIVMGVLYVLLLILRDQPVVGSLGLIYPVAASGHNYLALIR